MTSKGSRAAGGMTPGVAGRSSLAAPPGNSGRCHCAVSQLIMSHEKKIKLLLFK